MCAYAGLGWDARSPVRISADQCVQMPRTSTKVTLPLANIAKTLGKAVRPDTEPFTLNLSHMFILAEQGLDASGKGLSTSFTRFLFDPNSGKACTVSAIHKSYVACAFQHAGCTSPDRPSAPLLRKCVRKCLRKCLRKCMRDAHVSS